MDHFFLRTFQDGCFWLFGSPSNDSDSKVKKYQSVLQNCYLSTKFILFLFLMLEWRYGKVIMTLKFYSKCPNQPSFSLSNHIFAHIFCWNILIAEFFFSYINLSQRQPSIVVLTRRCFENMLQIYSRKTTFLKSYPSLGVLL